MDFFYLPIDFRQRSNYGYCFLNFTSVSEAHRFQSVFQGLVLEEDSGRQSEVCFARVQGKAANVEQFRCSPINGIPIKRYVEILHIFG